MLATSSLLGLGRNPRPNLGGGGGGGGGESARASKCDQ